MIQYTPHNKEFKQNDVKKIKFAVNTARARNEDKSHLQLSGHG